MLISLIVFISQCIYIKTSCYTSYIQFLFVKNKTKKQALKFKYQVHKLLALGNIFKFSVSLFCHL